MFICRLKNKYGQQVVLDRFKKFERESCAIGADSPIWVCWWQGEEQMPEVVRACYHSIRKHACGHPVILITEANCNEYLKLPDLMWEKQEKGTISLTHFSDLARMYLLKEYGGIWVDATNFITQDIDSFINTASTFWTCHHISLCNNVSRGLWTSSFFACGKGHLIPCYLYDSLIHYWQENDRLAKYLLMDFLFTVGYEGIPAMREEIDRVPMMPMGDLRGVLNRKFDPDVWNFHCNQVGFQKLSWKKKLEKFTPAHEKTHYAHFLEEYSKE
ncbi:capsular polysaccharide synthesis protein [gut metagenome]|uniref:Capsular polysaccharide synthesis protein n=1 Tax=gut metagenome TaxID=749906 RepID=J9D5A6_9ZZZZ